MQTMQINLIEPNALKVLQGLEDLKLIQIQSNKSDKNRADKNKAEKKDRAKMSEAEFYAMIDKASNSPRRPLTDELRKELFDV